MKKIEKKYKILIGIIVIEIIYMIIAYFVLFKEDYKVYFVFDNLGNYECSNRQCELISNDYLVNLDLKFNVQTSDKKILENYSLKSANSWNIFDSTGKWYNEVGDFTAYSSDTSVQFLDLNSRKINSEEEKELLKILKEYSISDLNNLYINEVYDLALNNNEENDKIVIVSNNAYDEENNDDKLYNVVYVKIDNKINVLVSEVYENKEKYDIPSYMLFNSFKINDEDTANIVIDKIYFSEVKKPEISIYKIKKNKLTKIN